MGSAGNKFECLTLNHIWLAWAENLVQEEVKVLAAAHEGEASFASDYSQRVFPSKIDVVSWYCRVHGMTSMNSVRAKNG
jgi:hypothetical protein